MGSFYSRAWDSITGAFGSEGFLNKNPAITNLLGGTIAAVGNYYASRDAEKRKGQNEKELFLLRNEAEALREKNLLDLRHKYDMEMNKFKAEKDKEMMQLQSGLLLQREEHMAKLQDDLQSQYYKVPNVDFERYSLTANESPNLATGGILTEMRKRKEQAQP